MDRDGVGVMKMFHAGEVVYGPYFPENVEVKRCELLEDFYIIEAIGRETNQFL